MGITQEKVKQIIKSFGMVVPQTDIKRVTFLTVEGGMSYVNVDEDDIVSNEKERSKSHIL